MKKSGTSAFAVNLCMLMKQKGIKAHELGSAIGVSRQAVTQYMNDEVEPKMRTFKAIAEYFGVSCDFLLGRTRTPAADETLQTIYMDIGLSDESLERLKKHKFLREVVNLLLSNPHGIQALKRLAEYYYTHYVSAYETALVYGEPKSISSRLSDETVELAAKGIDDNFDSDMKLVLSKKILLGEIENNLLLARYEFEKILPQEPDGAEVS